MKVGEIQVELIFAHYPGNSTGAAVVPEEAIDQLNREREELGHKATWWTARDPENGRNRPAFTPIEGGKLRLIEDRGIRHGERFRATFDVNEVTRNGQKQRQMSLVQADPLRS